jgi:hypothetical protein
VLDLMLLQAARGRLIARNAEYLSLDESVGQFAIELAGEKLQESGVDEVLDPDDYADLVETVAIAIATGMHVVLEAGEQRSTDPGDPSSGELPPAQRG